MDNDNWLEAEVIACPSCGMKLYAVVHSPFYDCDWLYCDNCPIAVEVNWYDPRFLNRFHEYSSDQIESTLNPCECGGRFRFDSPRHCFACGVEVPAASQKDLFPYTGCEDGRRSVTDADSAKFEQFESQFLRRHTIWRS
jgi:hypothetical protein